MPIEIRHAENPFKQEPAYDGIERRVLAFTDDLVLVHYTVEEGAISPAHTHDVTHQAVYLTSSHGCSHSHNFPIYLLR